MSPPVSPGDPDTDRVLARIHAASSALSGVRDLRLAEAAAHFDALHGELQNALADLDQA